VFSVEKAAAVCLGLLSLGLSGSLSVPFAHDGAPPIITRPAAIHQAPNSTTPLAAVVTLETDEPAVIAVEINGAVPAIPDASPRTQHAIPVLGLRAGTTNAIVLSLIDSNGNVAYGAARLEIETPPLPADFPQLTTTVRNIRKMEPGVTLMMVAPSGGGSGFLLAVDDAGRVVWYHRPSRSTGDAKRMRNGNLLYIDFSDAVEIDMLGNVVQRWRTSMSALQPGEATEVAVNPIHHELTELPSGNLLALSHEIRRLENYPTSETDPRASPAATSVVGDLVVEFARDGTIVSQWSLFDIVDPFRMSYDSLAGFWDSTYSTYGPTRDWSHANSATYDPSDDSFIVSMRHQDAVIKFRRDGRLVWILGNPNRWNNPWAAYLLRPSGSLEWPFHQHAAKPTPWGTLLMFDNGNYRATPFETKRSAAETYSRAVEYKVDPQTMTVSQVWSFGGLPGDVFYSSALGNVEMLPRTENILITDGFRNTDAQGKATDSGTGASRWARVVEVTHETPAQKVFELIVGDPSRTSPPGWTVYRAVRMPSLYRETTVPVWNTVDKNIFSGLFN